MKTPKKVEDAEAPSRMAQKSYGGPTRVWYQDDKSTRPATASKWSDKGRIEELVEDDGTKHADVPYHDKPSQDNSRAHPFAYSDPDNAVPEKRS